MNRQADLITESQNREIEARKACDAEMAKILAESAAFKAAHGGLSRSEFAPSRFDRYQNSNVSGGGL